MQARTGLQQGSRAREGEGVSDSMEKQVAKIFLSFSVCDENITFRVACFGRVAYTAVGYQFVTVSHFSPSTNTPSLYSAVLHSPEEYLVQDPAAGVKSPSVSDNGLTAGHGVGLK